MQRFAFNLERVLKVKRQQGVLAEQEQARARHAAAAAHAHVCALRDRLVAISQATAGLLGQSTAPHQWVAAFETAERLSEAIVVAAQVAAARDAEHQAATEKRKQLAVDVEAIDTLRQQRFTEWRKERQQMEQEASDELSTRRLAARTGAA